MAESFLVDFELFGCEGLRHPWICYSKNPDRATCTSLGLRRGLQVSRILHSNEHTVCLTITPAYFLLIMFIFLKEF